MTQFIPESSEGQRGQPVTTNVVQPFRFPHDVDGWLTEAEGQTLYDYARDKWVLEIGAYCGKSTICLAQSAIKVVTVDTFTGLGTPNPRNTWIEFNANLARYDVEAKVKAYRGMGSVVLREMAKFFDRGFIDGAHDFKSVVEDTNLALACLKASGLLLFHDYNRASDPDVTAAVDDLLSQGALLLRVVDTVAVVRPAVRVVSLEEQQAIEAEDEQRATERTDGEGGQGEGAGQGDRDAE